MSAFPSWIRKTYWRKQTAGAQMNMVGGMLAMLGSDRPIAQAALARGLPTAPVWIKRKPEIDEQARGLRLLEASVTRRLKRETSEARQREAAVKVKQAACRHQRPEGFGGRCPLCGFIF